MHGLEASSLATDLDRFRGIYGTLFPRFESHCLLDSCGWAGETGGFYLMAFEAQETVTVKGTTLWHDDRNMGFLKNIEPIWDLLTKRTRFEAETQALIPFYQGWIGAMGYEFAGILEPATQMQAPEPEGVLAEWVRFAHRVVWHPESGTFGVYSEDEALKAEVEGLWAADTPPPLPKFNKPGMLYPPTPSMTEAEFCERVQTIQDHIAQGDLYQANLSIRFEIPRLDLQNLWALYLTLVTQNPSPFSGMFITPEVQILSNSPERLVRGNAHTQRLDTRPIAGTRGRAKTPEEAQKIAHTLTQDVKEQAEHMMLVDLERNDLGRVSAPGSVQVSELGVLEQYSHVTHLVSQVEGQWAEATSPWDVLEAMFPGGTITGCPKIRCIDILSHLEPVPRGFYTGSLGYVDDRGHLDWNILIRSLFGITPTAMAFHAGAGIVADSVGPWEHRECYRKAAAIEGALGYDRHTVCH